MFVAGLVISNLAHQVAYSELYFFDTGFVAGAIVAAGGLRLAWMDAGSALPMTRHHVVVALGAVARAARRAHRDHFEDDESR